MILDFTDENNIRRIIDLNQAVSVIYNPEYSDNKGRVIFYLSGGLSTAFDPPDDMDMDLVLASVANIMKRKGNE